MNDTLNNIQGKHVAYLSLGSNINPVENLRQAVGLLRERTRLLALSTCWESEAVVAGQITQVKWPNFYNLGVQIITPLDQETLKMQVLRPIEHELGRVRGVDKYAPRTIDLDIVVFDGQVVDAEIWRRLYLSLIFAEMLPGLRSPETGELPGEAAARLSPGKTAIRHPEIIFP